jgi:predicted small secreted protein
MKKRLLIFLLVVGLLVIAGAGALLGVGSD